MRFARDSIGKPISRNNSDEFRKTKEREDSKTYKAVQAATAFLAVGALVGLALASHCVIKKEEKHIHTAKAVLCEDKMGIKDGKDAKEIPECIDALTGKKDKAKTVSNSSD